MVEVCLITQIYFLIMIMSRIIKEYLNIFKDEDEKLFKE